MGSKYIGSCTPEGKGGDIDWDTAICGVIVEFRHIINAPISGI